MMIYVKNSTILWTEPCSRSKWEPLECYTYREVQSRWLGFCQPHLKTLVLDNGHPAFWLSGNKLTEWTRVQLPLSSIFLLWEHASLIYHCTPTYKLENDSTRGVLPIKQQPIEVRCRDGIQKMTTLNYWPMQVLCFLNKELAGVY